MRAMIENAQAGEVVQGGSTITQQLVGATLGLNQFDRSFEGKFQELALAIRVEEKYTKPEILELYLNQVYFGNGIYGIGTASEFYFRKPARRLTLAEAATLAGMIRVPEYYDPLDHPTRRWCAATRCSCAWGRSGASRPSGFVRAGGAREGTAPRPARGGRQTLPEEAAVLRALHDQAGARERERTVRRARPQRQGAQAHAVRGRAQDHRRPSTRRGRSTHNRRLTSPTRWRWPPNGKAHPDTSIVTVDARSGAIRTMLSGKNFMRDELALATDPHPTGSAFKPFVLAAAFEQGVPPTQTYSSTSPFCSPLWQDEDHCVSNAEGSGHGRVDLWTATEDSINVVFAQLILDIGPETVPPVASKMGVTNELPPVAALATGSAEVSPLDMAVGFATLANGGVHCTPYTVQTIVRDGKPLYEHEPDCERVLRPDIAHLISAMLQRVPVSGTAAGAFSAGWGPWPVAGKTGTGDLNKAVWFCGYTRQLATAVWVGSNGNPYTLGSVFGGTVAAPIWRTYMIRVMQGLPVLGFPEPPPPPTATVPDVTGLDREAAVAQLEAAGFNAAVTEVDSLEPSGHRGRAEPRRRIDGRPRHLGAARGEQRQAAEDRGARCDRPRRGRSSGHPRGRRIPRGGRAGGREGPGQGGHRDPPGPARRHARPGGRDRDGRRRERKAKRPRARARTLACTTEPSTWPFALAMTAPMTFPMSCIDAAPVAAIASSTSASTASSDSWAGAYAAITSRSDRSRSASSVRPACSKASIDSVRFFTWVPATSRTSSSESSWPTSSSL